VVSSEQQFDSIILPDMNAEEGIEEDLSLEVGLDSGEYSSDQSRQFTCSAFAFFLDMLLLPGDLMTLYR